MVEIIVIPVLTLLVICVISIFMSVLQVEQYTPMTYDEEMKWLMAEHGLSWDEANNIASSPSRY